jgi:RNA polymerase sigma factor (sigma-70 family)
MSVPAGPEVGLTETVGVGLDWAMTGADDSIRDPKPKPAIITTASAATGAPGLAFDASSLRLIRNNQPSFDDAPTMPHQLRSDRRRLARLPTLCCVETPRQEPSSDRPLVVAVLAGDTTAFDVLYRAHVAAVRAVARSHVRDADTVADIVQDTFTRALQKLSDLRDLDRFRPWLLSIARHAAVDQIRAGHRVISLDADRADALVSGDASPGDLVELGELAERVRGCVSGLSQRDATAVALVTQFGFTPAQVAAALGVTPGAAKVIVHRARRRLRRALMLELLVQQPQLGCAVFHSIDATDPAAASRHLDDCPLCLASAGAELMPSRRRVESDVEPASSSI